MEDQNETAAKCRKIDIEMDEFRCAVCFEYLRPGRILQCKHGHIICEVCLRRMIKKECPMCKDASGFSRSLLGERMVTKVFQDVNISCRYSELCQTFGSYRSVSEHEQYCLYRHEKCPLSLRRQCKFSGTLKTLLSHIKQGIKKSLENANC